MATGQLPGMGSSSVTSSLGIRQSGNANILLLIGGVVEIVQGHTKYSVFKLMSICLKTLVLRKFK